MFCLSKRSNGVYYVYYNSPSGKRNCISPRREYKAEVNKFLTNFKEELKRRNDEKLISISLSEFKTEFINYSKTIHAAKTVKGYDISLKFLSEYLGDILVGNITNSQMIKYFEHRINASSIFQARKDLICLHSCFNYAVKHKMMSDNPCNGIKRFKIPEKQPMFFSEIDFEILLKTIDDKDMTDLIVFAVNTGLRQMEFLTLT